MKNTIKFTTVVAFMFVTLISKAGELKSTLATSEEGKTLTFKLDAPSEETKITLLNQDNITIYSENVSEQIGYFKKFDLNNLESGVYTMNVEDSTKIIVYTISLSDNKTEIIERKENAKPVFRTKDQVVYLNLLNLNKKDVVIKVYDNSNRTIFSQTMENDMIVEKAFNFANAVAGEYTVSVKDSNEVYYESITIK